MEGPRQAASFFPTSSASSVAKSLTDRFYSTSASADWVDKPNKEWGNSLTNFSNLFKNPVTALFSLCIAGLAICALVLVVLYFTSMTEGMLTKTGTPYAKKELRSRSSNAEVLFSSGRNQIMGDAYARSNEHTERFQTRLKEGDLNGTQF
jgi:hypothetical protein